MNLDLKNPSVQKLALSILLSGGLLAVFFFTHFVPFAFPNQSEKISGLKSQYEQKSTELARARATVADLPRFEAEYEQLHQQWSAAAELLPMDKELPTLLRRVTLAAEETGCQFVSFRPTTTRPQQYYTEMPMQIQVTGGYHQVGSFMAELANMRRIITVSGVHLKPNTKLNDVQTTSADFTASAYSLNNSPAPAPPAPAAPKKEGAANAHKSS
ncbi:MAG TPA: type 4a pilus biogenesis protein PilO [Candidatus Udaeobacter sp.]|jgi:type IV pilus assembly protein PilO|nr:type 4a pilus biogenesis protein PilO [Candidatus Udaeobacter sp.]